MNIAYNVKMHDPALDFLFRKILLSPHTRTEKLIVSRVRFCWSDGGKWRPKPKITANYSSILYVDVGFLGSSKKKDLVNANIS